MKRLEADFFQQDALTLAPLLLGKILVRKLPNNKILKYRITEVEAYCGEEDSACHARVGKTNRTKVLYKEGGYSYVYLCYGIHFLFNIVSGIKDYPQAVLIRGVEGYDGPGKLTKAMDITTKLNDIDLVTSNQLWIEDDGTILKYETSPRIGINYASEPYRSIHWRFFVKNDSNLK